MKKKYYIDKTGTDDELLSKYLLQRSLAEDFQLKDEVLEHILGNFDEFYAMVQRGISVEDATKFFML